MGKEEGQEVAGERSGEEDHKRGRPHPRRALPRCERAASEKGEQRQGNAERNWQGAKQRQHRAEDEGKEQKG